MVRDVRRRLSCERKGMESRNFSDLMENLEIPAHEASVSSNTTYLPYSSSISASLLPPHVSFPMSPSFFFSSPPFHYFFSSCHSFPFSFTSLLSFLPPHFFISLSYPPLLPSSYPFSLSSHLFFFFLLLFLLLKEHGSDFGRKWGSRMHLRVNFDGLHLF